MSRAVLSIGSNLDDRLATLRAATEFFRPWLHACSSVYETPPWGPVPQQDFLNAVLLVDDPRAAPRDWLGRAHAAENEAGRTREVRWGPRTLDVDVVDVDGLSSGDPELTLPHPRAAQRAFVLIPWAEVAPDAMLGGRHLDVLIEGLDEADRMAVRRVDEALR